MLKRWLNIYAFYFGAVILIVSDDTYSFSNGFVDILKNSNKVYVLFAEICEFSYMFKLILGGLIEVNLFFCPTFQQY